jgi:hypothetical protein
MSSTVETAMEIRPFHVDVPDEALDDLRRRIGKYGRRAQIVRAARGLTVTKGARMPRERVPSRKRPTHFADAILEVGVAK